ncbi:MAG: DUF6873 family GME fold protein [Eubacteriales bacterium]
MSGDDRFCVVSVAVPEAVRKNLHKIFGEVLFLPPDPSLAEPVRSHPDMIFSVLQNRMFLPQTYYDAHTALLERLARLGGFSLHPCEEPRGSVYPMDVGFNAAVGQDFLLCRPDAVSPSLLACAAAHGYRVIPVKQGYAACSCLVTDAAVLTFDCGIAKVLEHEEIPHLLLKSGGISLPGYDCGFLGGASGFFDGTIYLYGNTVGLRSRDVLERFVRANGYRMVSLYDGPVTDYGGIKIFKKQER